VITGIYQITNLRNGKSYVGSAVRFNSRWRLHKTQLSQGKHHSVVMQRAWDKYGETAFEFKRLLVCAKEDLLWFEQRAIDVLKPAYNICKVAGSVLGYRHTEEAKKEAAERATGNTHRRGRKEPAEVCARISAGRKGKGLGRVFTEETKEKIAAAQRGRTLTEEQKENLRRINTGRKQSPETIEKRMQKLRGRTRPADAIARTAAANTGQKRNPEQLLAMSRCRTKLSEADVREIRRRVAGGESQSSVAKDFGLTQSGVCSIHKRKTHTLVI
jgi:group I intron endonuclease